MPDQTKTAREFECAKCGGSCAVQYVADAAQIDDKRFKKLFGSKKDFLLVTCLRCAHTWDETPSDKLALERARQERGDK